MRILFDTNVVLDVLLDREPFSTVAAQLFSGVEQGEIEGYLCATTITTIHYLAAKTVGTQQAAEEISKLLMLFRIAPVTHGVLEAALQLEFPDFEDAVLYEAGRHAGANGLVTRDSNGFKQAEIPVYSPEEYLLILKAQKKQGI